ncbi:hypothetical protein [Rhizobium leguminosarum]
MGIIKTHASLICALVVAIMVLGGWFIFSDQLLAEVWSCGASVTGPKQPVWDGRLACMNASELGDVLAGFFAPAAFVVLVVAVVLQGLELKAQRQELADTREVFVLQNELIRAQTEATVQSAVLFRDQNDILRAQEDARIEQAKKDAFEDTLKRLANLIHTRLIGRSPLLAIEPSASPYASMTTVLKPLFQKRLRGLSDDPNTAIGSAVTSAVFQHFSFSDLNTVQVYNRYGHRETFQAAIALISRASDQARELGDDTTSLLNELRTDSLKVIMQLYLNNGPGEHNGPLEVG